MIPPRYTCPFWWLCRYSQPPVWGIWHCCACIWGRSYRISGWEDLISHTLPSLPVRVLRLHVFWRICHALRCCCRLRVLSGGRRRDYFSRSRAPSWVLQWWVWGVQWIRRQLTWLSLNSRLHPLCLGRCTRCPGLWWRSGPLRKGRLSCFE